MLLSRVSLRRQDTLVSSGECVFATCSLQKLGGVNKREGTIKAVATSLLTFTSSSPSPWERRTLCKCP
jgi:hypothetical protein